MSEKLLAALAEVTRERDEARRELETMRPVVEKARAWRRLRNFAYRPGEINLHLTAAHQEDLDLARAVDEWAADR